MDLDSNPDILLVRKHLVQHLGPPQEVFEVRGSPIPTSPIQALHLSYFAPGGPEAPVVFATCGACLFKMNDGRRVEALMLFRRQPTVESFPPIHRVLASFAIFSEANNEAVRIGDVVRAPEDLHQFCRMDAVLFLPPVPFVETFHRIALTQGESVDVVWLLPVYEKEASYALTYGPQALMLLFAAQGLDLTDTARTEADTDIAPEAARALAQQRSEQEKRRAAQDPRGGPARARALRRPQGEGSFEVQDDAQIVTVIRRGAKPKAKEAAPPATPPPPPASPPKLVAVPDPEPAARSAPAPASRPAQLPQRARPLRVAPVKPEPVVRFAVPGRGPQERLAAKKPAPAAAPAPRAETPARPPVETPESRAEAKRKRVEELKAKAAEAAKRAEARTKPKDDKPEP